ncbi:MAG: late competence development ComFB family protein [Candidatus Omnitrophica bacterium]|nr:late competence development ComFB family protein [Candidatus Omnitrophota bacterium]
MNAHNIMEEIVQNHLDAILSSNPGICKCSKCIDAILSRVLSTLPAKYITTDSGAMYTLIDQVKVEQSSEILKELMKVLEDIKNHPLHQPMED